MASDDGSLWIVYNGEVYNHAEIRQRLEAQGVRFKTRCDTEVILRLYEARGPACVEELLGMFAFAICDAKRERLFLARDRHRDQAALLVRSRRALPVRLRADRAASSIPSVSRELDLESLYHHLSFLSTPLPRTMFEGIHKLAPGHRMTVDRSGVRIERWWDALDAPRLDPSDDADEGIVRRRSSSACAPPCAIA